MNYPIILNSLTDLALAFTVMKKPFSVALMSVSAKPSSAKKSARASLTSRETMLYIPAETPILSDLITAFARASEFDCAAHNIFLSRFLILFFSIPS